MEKVNVLKETVLEIIRQAGLNTYDAAVMDEDGIEWRLFQFCNHCNNSYSVTKAFTMTAIGILQDDGKLTVQDKVTDFFPGWNKRGEFDDAWEKVSIENALMHRIGFADDFQDLDEDMPIYLYQDHPRDYLREVWRTPLGYEPGEHYAYSDTAFYLLSRIVSAVTGKRLDEFLRERLTEPMLFGPQAWSVCPAGYPDGATGLYASAADTVKLAWLYLQGGVYQGKRIVSEAWVRQVLDKGYELKPLDGTRLIGKRGMLGQIIFFDPVKKYAASWHSCGPNDCDSELLKKLARMKL